MNFLAHIFLSGDNLNVQVGNVLGEFVKGRLENYHPAGLHQDVLLGVKMHRSIDHFTDTHPEVRASKRIINKEFGLFSGVAIDMYFDHFLARNFHTFSGIPLPFFAQKFYNYLLEIQPLLPREMDKLVTSMTEKNWLVGYATHDGLDWALRGIARRFPSAKVLENGLTVFQQNESAIYLHFERFFPDLQIYCNNFHAANARERNQGSSK